MNQQDEDFELYQAFHLGLLVAATLHEEQFETQGHLRPALDVLRAVVSKDTAIHDPQAEIQRNPAIAQLIAQTSPGVFQLQRQLAEKILRGKESQFQVKEVPPRG